MKFCNLKRVEEAPASGMILAYTRKRVIFQPFTDLAEVERVMAGQQILELHLFDQEKEYRSVATRSQQYENGLIEAVIDFEESDSENIYQEEVLLENAAGGGSIMVLHHLKYSEKDGMIMVDNYRLKMGGVQ